MNFVPFIFKRAARSWRLLLVVAVGVIVATGLLASAPILIDFVIELGLPRKLAAVDQAESNIRVSTYEALGEIDYRDIDEPIQAQLQTSFAGFIDQIVLSIGTHWMHPWLGDTLLPNERVNFRRFDDIENQIIFDNGAWPSDYEVGQSPEGLPIYPAVIGETMSDWYEITTGDLLPLSFRSNADAPDVLIEVVAVVRPADPSSAYWLGSRSPLVSQANQRYDQQLSVIVPAEAFHKINQELFPLSNAELAWHVILDLEAIRARDIPALINALGELPIRLGNSVTYESNLRDLLLDFYTQAQGIRTPLLLLTAEIVLLALIYVVMTASLAVQAVEREFAVLRSRGASRRQVIRIQLTEAALISMIAWIAGPALGSLLINFLGRFGPLSDLTGASTTLGIPDAAWTAAFFGALAGVAGLLLPVGPALRRSIVGQVQSTGRLKRPLWQRLYLDVMLLALGLVLLFRFQYFGGFATGRIDWLLMLSPLILLLGAATLVIRIAPPILNLIARVAASTRGLAAPLAFWQTARNPGQFTGLVVLLTLANALGILATGLNATLNASEIERSRYAAGSDYRFVGGRSLNTADFSDEPGVKHAVGVWRETATVNLKNYRSFPSFDLLALDPRTFTQVTVYRSDFSDEPMGELLGQLLSEDVNPGLEIPGRPGELGLWIYATPDTPDDPNTSRLNGDSDRDRLGFFGKVITASGESFLFELTPRGSPEGDWAYYATDLPELGESDYPLSLHSLWFRHRARVDGEFSLVGLMSIAIDDIQAVDAETGETALIEGFEDPLQVISHELRGTQNDNSLFVYSRSGPFDGDARANVLLSYARILTDIGIVFNIADREDAVLPALVSEHFLEATELTVGEQVEVFVSSQAVTFEIRGVVRYFPTLYGDGAAGFMVTSSEDLLVRLGNDTSAAFSFNEIMVDADETEPPDPVSLAAGSRSEIVRIFDADLLRQVIKADPMALGLRGVTYLGYFLTSLLSIIGFGTFFYMSIRTRARSFGILRAMGMSPRQLYISLAVEQGLIILTGLVLGALLGAVLNTLVLPGLPITLGDQLTIPPFLPRSDWRSVLQVFGTLLLVFSATFGAATWLLWRGRIHEALRYE